MTSLVQFCMISVTVKFRGEVRYGPSYKFLRNCQLVKYLKCFTNRMNSYE